MNYGSTNVHADRVHALVVTLTEWLVQRDIGRGIDEIGRESDFGERLGQDDAEVLVALVVNLGAHRRVERSEYLGPLGLFGGGATWALPLIPMRAITIEGSYVGNVKETQELIDLVIAKKVAPIPVTTLPLAKANEALVDLQKGKLVGRAVLIP